MEYQPLDIEANEIRVLELVPSTALPEPYRRLIRCRLINVSLNAHTPEYAHFLQQLAQGIPAADTDIVKATLASDKPEQQRNITFTWGEYFALSYTWGDPSITRPIIVNGHVVEVTENLEKALRVLRDRPEFKSGVKLWVDALCINQKDVAERNREVKRMRDIYALAANIVIWLGDGQDWLGDRKEDGQAAIECISRLHADFSQEQETREREVAVFVRALNAKPDLLGVGIWATLYSFLDRPYWNRCWILQELTFTQLGTAVLCGESATTWWEVLSVAMLLEMFPKPELGSVIHKDLERVGVEHGRLNVSWSIRRLLGLLKLSAFKDENSDRPGIEELLELARHAGATDPRDKIYSLLGMMDSRLADAVEVDYQLPVLQVFEDFAKLLLNDSNSLEFLRQGNGANRDGWPSWVPDFTRVIQQNQMESVSNGYRASGDYRPIFSFPDNHIMTCQGVFVDMVDGIGCKIWDEDGCCKNGTSTKSAYGTPEDNRDALWRTLVGDRAQDGGHVPQEYSTLLELPWWDSKSLTDELILAMMDNGWEDMKLFTKANADFQMLRSQNRDFRLWGQRFQDYFPAGTGTPSCRHFGALISAVGRVWSMMYGRRLVTTVDGRFGWVPGETMQGDHICVLLGCSTPLIMRRCGENYRVVGECYVHGIMNGEAVGDLNADEAQSFVLC
ncbi:heterokaryon incompatibility protein-domain-containing protein [Hyaloscypha sp. PMI_1271]|nr:heterokaryon incompatibility protein-domain-containing protein [Hyaloscypha sp. PMI_1271]